MYRSILSLLLLVSVCLAAGAAEYVVPLSQQAPTLDGQVNPAEWGVVAGFDGLAWEGQLDRRQVRTYVAATATHLYFAFVSQLPAEGELTTTLATDTLKVVYDDAVEVWIDPAPGDPNGRSYQMLCNAKGFHAYDAHPRGNVAADPSWQGHWQIANGLHDGWWHCEIAVPITEIAPGRAATDGVWGINLCRDWKEPWAFSSLDGAAYAPDNVRFRFVPAGAPAVRHELRADPATGDVRSFLILSNPTGATVAAKADALLTRDRMPDAGLHESVTLAPGETRELPLVLKDDATRKFALSLKVASVDGQTVFYDRSLRWHAAAPYRWVARKAPPPAPIDFQFAYYPTLNRMRVAVDVTGLPADAKLTTLTATVRRHGAAQAVNSVRFDRLVEGKQELAFELPPLEGSYEIAVRGTGAGVPAGAAVKSFERTRYPWEHSRLGRSEKVYAPFTPLKVSGLTVASVLRRHTLTRGGLWSQVNAAGRDLLSAPMRYQLRRGGHAVALNAGPLRFVKTTPSCVAAEGAISAGGPFARTRLTMDVDGTMRVDLTLLPAKAPLESLTLEIPLKDAAAPLLHAMGDGIRNTLYQKVPAGDGVVWSAEKVRSDDLPKGFCSYIYVGGPNRGLCWFAENDRGWSWDRQTPNLELDRRGGTLTLRVHLVNRPLTVTVPRTITFGLLAAPVKPRLEPWRYTFWRQRYTVLGTDINWFALGDCGSVYPAGKDMYLWEKLRQGNREQLTDAQVQEVIDHGRKYYEPYGEEAVQRFVAHVRYNLRARYGTRMIFYYNRASYQAADEYQTFQDEWSTTDFRTVGAGNGIGEIKIVPSESYIDHALYWYGKSFDVGVNQGVYWDNWFFAGSYNSQMTAAYRREDGSSVPSTGIWGLRELAKRTFQYMNERGMKPITMPHMTSTSILPMLSFATVQYDWEWKYSEGDVQYRFPREYLQLVSNGELAGTWPVPLGDHGPQAEDPWIQRTFAGVCLVHEMAPDGAVRAVWDPLLKPIFALLDSGRARVYRYWDDAPQPVRADNPDVPLIVYAVPGREAVVVATSYVEGGAAVSLRIDAKALGFAGGVKVVDLESGQTLPIEGGVVKLAFKKHDLHELRIVPAGEAAR